MQVLSDNEKELAELQHACEAFKASAAEAGGAREQAVQQLEAERTAHGAALAAQVRLAAQVDSLSQELQSARAALQHHQVQTRHTLPTSAWSSYMYTTDSSGAASKHDAGV